MPGKIRALVVDDDESIAEVIAFILEHKCHASVTTVFCGNDAIAAIDAERFDLVVCDYNMPNGSGGDVFEHILEMEEKPHFILASSDRPVEHEEFSRGKLTAFLQKPFESSKLIDAFKEAFPIEEARILPGTFCRIRPLLLHSLNVLPCDLFIRLSSEKYVKVMNEGEIFGNGDLGRFKDKGVGFLFVKEENLQSIITKLVQLVTVQAKSALAKGSVSDVFEISESMQATIHDLGAELGYSPALENAVKANMGLACSLMEQNQALSSVLQGITINADNYVSSHSILLPYISCGMAELMDWHSEHTYQKLTLASLLHDCCLSDSGLARVVNESELENFSSQDQAKWREHTEKAAEISRRFTEIPADVEQIVSQHHELPDGSGFPNQLHHTRIAPLSALFIIAHDFLRYFEQHGTPDLPGFVAASQGKYNSGQFKRILAVLAQAKDLNRAA